MYKFIRSILFWFDAEQVHHFSMNSLKLLCNIPLIGYLVRKHYKHSNDSVIVCGMKFKNHVGLAAGFDKNAKYLKELEILGFGFVEIGTVTPVPQNGNDRPRLFRLPKDKALINRMGFNNDGAEKVARRLKAWREKTPAKKELSTEKEYYEHFPERLNIPLIIGGNIGKNKSTPNEDAWKDYEACFMLLHPYVDYFVVNVSSPNTAGLRELQEKEALKKIFEVLENRNSKFPVRKPIFLKIAPDLSFQQIDEIIDLSAEIHLEGLIVANTTICRDQLKTPQKKISDIGAGGLSGLPLKEKSTDLIKYIRGRINDKTIIIGSGGIFTGVDAGEKLDSGASLIQLWTGFIYEGPGIIKKIITYLGVISFCRFKQKMDSPEASDTLTHNR